VEAKMADEGDKNTDDGTGKDSDEGDTQNTDTGKGGDDKDKSKQKKLEDSSTEELIAYIKELRTESKGRRERIADLEKDLEGKPELQKRLKELEDKDKSEEEKRAERMKELEEAAEQVPGLQKAQEYVKKVLGERMKAVEEMDEDAQASIKSLLEDLPKKDYLGRLKVIDAVLAVSGGKKKESGDMDAGDTGNPAETGDGESSRTMAQNLAYSPMGMQEAQMAGLVKTKSE
jgi:hypothetical protein